MKKVEIKKSEGRGKDASVKMYGSFSMPENATELSESLQAMDEVNQRSLLRILENGLLVTARPKFEENEKSGPTFEIGTHLTLDQLLASRSRQAGIGKLNAEKLRLTSDFASDKISADVFIQRIQVLDKLVHEAEANRRARDKK